MGEYETLLYEENNGVATVTLNRPDKFNSFNPAMTDEISRVWRNLRSNDDVRCVILTGSGDKAFCTGIDREGIPDNQASFDFDPFDYEDPGSSLGPKANGLWKPVVAAVNGMACGGAFYFLGEVEFIIAAEHATFFDPHVTYGMAAVYEPTLMSHRMPFGEIMRLSLMGNYERMTAAKAEQIGLVSQVVASGELLAKARWAAEAIASQPPVAVQATVRNLWMARELSRQQAIEMGATMLHAGTQIDNLKAGQELFGSGRRIEWRSR